jgi:hypothetical protein
MEKTSTTQTALKWGAIAGIYSIISSLATFLRFFESSKILSISVNIIGFGIIIAILIYAFKDFKAQNNGYMTYSQGLGIGSLMGGVSGLMSGIFSFVYLKFFDSTVLTNAANLEIEKMEEKGLSSEQIEQTQSIMEMMTGPSMVFVANVLGGILGYFILSLIVAHFQKNEKSVFE